ncbi:MAG TPA: hypothetical protein VF328_08945 [Mycobacterium sp.]
MAATHTPQADKIRWRGGSHLNGGVSRFGEYFIAANRSITFSRPGAAPEVVPARSGSDADVYWACVDHNKTLLGITA